jgi:hypothetical protein
MRAGKGNLFVGFHCKLPLRCHRRMDWKQEEGFFFCTKDAGMLCAPQRRGSPVGGSPTQIVVGKSGS